MISVPSGVRVWLAGGVTDMRRGMNGLTLHIQEGPGRDPHAGDLFVFRGRRGDMIKVLWRTTASACRFTPSVSNLAGSSGRARRTAPSRSRRRSSAICSTRSTGAILAGRIRLTQPVSPRHFESSAK
jgi:hypothetical protein